MGFLLGLSEVTTLLRNIRDDCIEITWLVSQEISSKIREIGPRSKKIFTQHQIIKVLINEELVINYKDSETKVSQVYSIMSTMIIIILLLLQMGDSKWKMSCI